MKMNSLLISSTHAISLGTPISKRYLTSVFGASENQAHMALNLIKDSIDVINIGDIRRGHVYILENDVVQDNSDIQHKLRIRNDVFKFFDSIDCVFDLYAGNMDITKALWANIAGSVTCYDIKKHSLGSIPENVKFEKTDSKTKDVTERTAKVNVIDCDAYGLVIDHVSEILGASEVDKIVFFTDGTPTKHKKLNCKDDIKERVKSISDDYRLELNDAGTAYYGWVYKCASTKK